MRPFIIQDASITRAPSSTPATLAHGEHVPDVKGLGWVGVGLTV
jgi:hypothetical protein